jgi:hypothetical protein
MGWHGMGRGRSYDIFAQKTCGVSLHLFRVILLLLLHSHFEDLQLGLPLTNLRMVVSELVDHLAHAVWTSTLQHPGRKRRRRRRGDVRIARRRRARIKKRGKDKIGACLSYLHSSGRSPSGNVEEVGLPITAVEAALEE